MYKILKIVKIIFLDGIGKSDAAKAKQFSKSDAYLASPSVQSVIGFVGETMLF